MLVIWLIYVLGHVNVKELRWTEKYLPTVKTDYDN